MPSGFQTMARKIPHCETLRSHSRAEHTWWIEHCNPFPFRLCPCCWAKFDDLGPLLRHIKKWHLPQHLGVIKTLYGRPFTPVALERYMSLFGTAKMTPNEDRIPLLQGGDPAYRRLWEDAVIHWRADHPLHPFNEKLISRDVELGGGRVQHDWPEPGKFALVYSAQEMLRPHVNQYISSVCTTSARAEAVAAIKETSYDTVMNVHYLGKNKEGDVAVIFKGYYGKPAT